MQVSVWADNQNTVAREVIRKGVGIMSVSQLQWTVCAAVLIPAKHSRSGDLLVHGVHNQPTQDNSVAISVDRINFRSAPFICASLAMSKCRETLENAAVSLKASEDNIQYRN